MRPDHISLERPAEFLDSRVPGGSHFMADCNRLTLPPLLRPDSPSFFDTCGLLDKCEKREDLFRINMPVKEADLNRNSKH